MRKGSALLIALWAIAILSIIAISFAYEAFQQTGINVYVRERNRVNRLVDAGCILAEVVIADYANAPEWSESEDVEKMLSVLGLTERRNHLPSQLSGGQQQRVSIARALFNMPSVILADEPTGNLDSKNSREIMELLRQLNKEFGQTMLIITHDENIALLCDRVIAISDGKIVRDELTGRSRDTAEADGEGEGNAV